MAGRVLAGTRRIDKPGAEVEASCDLVVREVEPYVSRGGRKLAHALDHFATEVAGCWCLDAGCSTGGFTDCLLSRGAAHVFAVDVGYGQLAWKLRGDARVTVLERTNVRDLAPTALSPLPEVVVADLAFISLRKVLPRLALLAAPRAVFLLLVKPQFELPREDLAGAHGGVVTDPLLHDKAVALVEAAAPVAGLQWRGAVASPLPGADGNREFFVLLDRARSND